jgi:hypothetical protein
MKNNSPVPDYEPHQMPWPFWAVILFGTILWVTLIAFGVKHVLLCIPW